ncbi:hypothetical protein BLOT_012864 [Blomia tropicalis]|nr:hypothetical protein BLOT_012864 [Blomia tropicalis]
MSSIIRVRTCDGFINLYEPWLRCSPTMQTMLNDRRQIFINFPTIVIRNVFRWCRYYRREIELWERVDMRVYTIEEVDFILLQIHSYYDAFVIYECAMFLDIRLLANVSYLIAAWAHRHIVTSHVTC